MTSSIKCIRAPLSRFLSSILIWAVTASSLSLADASDEFFENRIRPVLATSCVQCHGEQRTEGGLRLDSQAALLKGGESGQILNRDEVDSSLFMRAIRRQDDVSAMPPEKEKALRTDQIEDFRKWIQNGAPWPAQSERFVVEKHWAFEPPAKTQQILTQKAVGDQNEIDTFIRIAQANWKAVPVGKADKRTLIRRATYDLTGLPPTSEEVAAFENDSSESAFATVIERLLDSTAYGERWGRHWLDVVRYADTAGETADYPIPTAWKYRDYVIHAFNQDMPYDQFVREQIAGDILANQSESKDRFAEQTIATGYLAISRRFGFDSENYHHLTIQDTIDNMGQAFLGLSLGCARCHDHKFDPVPMRDYYGLYGIFDSSRYPFPGSEQKQRLRCLVPLTPPQLSQPKFREYETKAASITNKLVALKQPVPQAALRSLHDLDGDFEVQAPAAGGSNGVLVPPWVYRGKIAVTNTAQSPFQNLYPRGKVGASIPSSTEDYRIEQAVMPYSQGIVLPKLYINLDFRPTGAETTGKAFHRFWIGQSPAQPLFEIELRSQSLRLLTVETLDADIAAISVAVNEWHNLQLCVDLASRSVSGTLCHGDTSVELPSVPFAESRSGTVDRVVFESVRSADETLSGMEFDNLSVQETEIARASTEIPSLSSVPPTIDVAKAQEEVRSLVGFDSGFEYQSEGQSPVEPWGPGPNSVVKILGRSQSPFTTIFPAGDLGIHMPNRGEYDGFGRTLPNLWKESDSENVYAIFDFRCASNEVGGEGTWRYYIGHGPGPSPALELFFNGHQFFRRSGDARDAICDIRVGQWYQVRLKLDLKNRSFRGNIVANSLERDNSFLKDFEGSFASGWDGSIDYTFIDSYGHVGGVRPSLDVDNYLIADQEISTQAQVAGSGQVEQGVLRDRFTEMRHRIRQANEQGLAAQAELQKLISEGPVPMAYAMAEGTPHSVRIQKRGEPDQLGEEVSRGFVNALGNPTDESRLQGSGRMELAQWIASPQNPLTARVMVNRIWQYHFGQGLVKTSNDFGIRGIPPTHPELLDYLAEEFVSHGWSIKHMHRLIMNSATYQRSSDSHGGTWDETANTRDAYTLFQRRRLSAEEIRDSILFVSASLTLSPSSEHPFPPPTSWGFSQHGPFIAVYEHDRRSVYLMTQRIKRHPFLALFDGADPNASTATRLSTTVPTQALYFLNDPFVHAKSTAIATNILAEQRTDTERIQAVYLRLMGRVPLAEEFDVATEFLHAYRAEMLRGASQLDINENKADISVWSALVRTLIGSNEFLHID